MSKQEITVRRRELDEYYFCAFDVTDDVIKVDEWKDEEVVSPGKFRLFLVVRKDDGSPTQYPTEEQWVRTEKLAYKIVKLLSVEDWDK